MDTVSNPPCCAIAISWGSAQSFDLVDAACTSHVKRIISMLSDKCVEQGYGVLVPPNSHAFPALNVAVPSSATLVTAPASQTPRQRSDQKKYSFIATT